MRKAIPEQIAANIRLSWLYSGLLFVLLTAFGAAIAGSYDAHAWPLGAAAAGLVGFGVALFARYQGPQTLLSLSHAREATPYEIQLVGNITEEMAIAAGLPAPGYFIIDDDSPNAFATGMDPRRGVICVTTGLLRKLNREELQGVIGHEMGHIRNNDIRFMTTLALVAGLIPLMADFFLRSTFWGGGRRSRDNDRGGDNGQLQIVFFAIALLFAILAPLFAKLLELAVSRKREFLADATSAQLTRNPEGLASALIKISQDPDPLEVANRATAHMYIVNPLRKSERWLNSMLSTHPDIEARVAALRGTAGLRTSMSPEALD